MQIYLFLYRGHCMGRAESFCGRCHDPVCFEGAYIAEIIRGSLLSIEGTQIEAARAVGFTSKQTLRYVVLPQMVARTLPSHRARCFHY